MTVAQLIALLQGMQQDAEIVIDDQDCTFFQYPHNVHTDGNRVMIYVSTPKGD